MAVNHFLKGGVMKVSDGFVIVLILIALSFAVSMFVAN
jgi:hypothetical protein